MQLPDENHSCQDQPTSQTPLIRTPLISVPTLTSPRLDSRTFDKARRDTMASSHLPIDARSMSAPLSTFKPHSVNRRPHESRHAHCPRRGPGHNVTDGYTFYFRGRICFLSTWGFISNKTHPWLVSKDHQETLPPSIPKQSQPDQSPFSSSGQHGSAVWLAIDLLV